MSWVVLEAVEHNECPSGVEDEEGIGRGIRGIRGRVEGRVTDEEGR